MTHSEVSNQSLPLNLDQQLDHPRVPASGDIPAELQKLLDPAARFYVRSDGKPDLDFTVTEVPDAPGVWQVDTQPELTAGIIGGRRTRLRPPGGADDAFDEESTDGYRPPWIAYEYIPPLRPFRIGDNIFLEPRAHEDTNRLSWPNCCVGLVTGSHFQGTGVLVGPNLMLTAGHNIPWDASSWSMDFIPASAPFEQPAFGRSPVIEVIGYDTWPEASGYDWAICRLAKPLGRVAGWMGAKSFGNQDTYFQRRYNSTGYPRQFQLRMAIELDMGLRDIDNDSPGLELEFAKRNDFQEGWSGGPLWLPDEGPGPRVMGIMSGLETDELDPERLVFAGGKGMIDLIRQGAAAWPP